MIVILSGPRTAESQARNALAGAGYKVRADSHDHGLEPTVTGAKVRQAVAFLTLDDVADVDAAVVPVASLKYVLRMHYEPGPVPEPSTADLLRDELVSLRADVEALKGVRA